MRMAAPATVGIIANPASGKDIRRLVAYGTVFDNQEKVNIVRRVLLALSGTGVERVLYMPDYYGIVAKAVAGMRRSDSLNLEIAPLEIELTATQLDSSNAAAALAEAGAGCIVTLGGDGTNRMVAKSCGDVPLLPISTGTNNVFPFFLEGTIAGLAAGAVAQGYAGADAVYRSKRLTVFRNGAPVDIALIDAVVLDNLFVASRAMWEVEDMRMAVFTRGEAHNIGIASLLGTSAPVTVHDPWGASIVLDPLKRDRVAAIAPGLLLPVGTSAPCRMELGESVEIAPVPCIVALDGEREVEFQEGDRGEIRLDRDGPNVVAPDRALRNAVAGGFFSRPEVLGIHLQ
ncbi:NAD(+)/NADH kinase [Pyramidobacter sp.]|uniref:NAD(+)/NADH kinase n=1 Tax=Pyramidobacter sp. TaxID=1943581 RepID=UPI0025D1C430|nr:NAD(+)/NADH kinase [Pyramidobacter sp.]MCI7403540.1 NAD(+)/NADH kinase [Pyramidobacter sp.]